MVHQHKVLRYKNEAKC